MTGSTGGSNDTYAYDLNGNPNSTGYSTGAGNELTNSPGVTYTYDNDGNLVTAKTSSVTTTYTYDYENRLTSVDQNGTVIATYTYNALGQRIAIDDSGTKTWTVYNGTSADANPYADFTSSGAVSVRYLFGPAVDQILARTSSSGTTAWYLTDQLGSVRFIEDTSGDVLDAISYERSATSPARRIRRTATGSCLPGCNTTRRLGFTTIMRGIMIRRSDGS